MSKLSQLREKANKLTEQVDMTRFEIAIEKAINDGQFSVVVEPGEVLEFECLEKEGFTVQPKWRAGTTESWTISWNPQPKQRSGRLLGRMRNPEWD